MGWENFGATHPHKENTDLTEAEKLLLPLCPAVLLQQLQRIANSQEIGFPQYHAKTAIYG
jgi:hypothetical protein